jgi:subtilisin family serine protease
LAGERYLVRARSEEIGGVAKRHGLKVIRGVGPDRNLFQVEFAGGASSSGIRALAVDPSVQNVELDGAVVLPEVAGAMGSTQLSKATQRDLRKPGIIDFFGTAAPDYYRDQRAVDVISLRGAWSFATGAGIVAVLDTGADVNHPVLRDSLVEGYDFTRNAPGGSEMKDLDQSTTAILDARQSTTAILDKTRLLTLNQSTTAILDQSTTAILDGAPLPKAFGHGTMVAGVIHLAAPTAKIMPVKVFDGDGVSTISQIVDGIHYAVDHGAAVLNMSFSSSSPSVELANAVEYAVSRGAILVASAGNGGERTVVYPAAYGIIGVGSTNNTFHRSAFSNYGNDLVSVAAPGEEVVTLYPGNNYAVAWGTSFSAPFVAGGAALIHQLQQSANQAQAARALTKAIPLPGQELGAGELNLVMAAAYAFPRRN